MLCPKKIVLLFVAGTVALCALLPADAQLSTADHLADPNFWPTKNAISRNDYAGSAACASCHTQKAASQRINAMALSARPADQSGILHAHPDLSFNIRKYHYQITTSATGSTYQVTDSVRTLSARLLWAFGTGRVGQSYLFKKDDGKFYEARVTYFDTLQNLHFTPTRALDAPKDLEEAMYRPVDLSEIKRCFGCHSTGATVGDVFDEKSLVPGVTCEACHGGGAKHVAAAEAAKLAGMSEAARGTIFNPAQLMPVDSVDFCGACHGTFWDVKLSSAKGVDTVKAQPYRLESSKCWSKPDSRLTCVACHNPHEPLQKDPLSYDAACLSCHARNSKPTDQPLTARAAPPNSATVHVCPVSDKNCVTCHMPKVFVPDMHYSFTDHRIRIVHAGESYPE